MLQSLKSIGVAILVVAGVLSLLLAVGGGFTVFGILMDGMQRNQGEIFLLGIYCLLVGSFVVYFVNAVMRNISAPRDPEDRA